MDELPFAISQFADAGYNTNVGALAAPFGDVLVASDNGTNYRLAKLTNYDTACTWTSLIIPLSQGKYLAFIQDMIVYTNALGSGASVNITLKYNDEASNSGAKTINTASQRRHVVSIGQNAVENVRVYIDWSGGSSVNPVEIRSIELIGHVVER